MGSESLLAGKRYEVECETTGSRPPAVITWYKGRRRQLKHTKVREGRFSSLREIIIRSIDNSIGNRKYSIIIINRPRVELNEICREIFEEQKVINNS